MIAAIILASGKGTRMGGVDKCFLSLGAKPVVAWSLQAFEKSKEVSDIILVVRKDQMAAARGLQMMFGVSRLKAIVVGGARRQDSVAAALRVLPDEARYVVIHDAARPCVTPELIDETLRHARRFGSGIAARPVVDTIKVAGKGMLVEATPDRATLWAVQTPQAFEAGRLLEAYRRFGADKKTTFTDDAAMLEALGDTPRLVRWDAPNPKITTPIDLTIAAALLRLN